MLWGFCSVVDFWVNYMFYWHSPKLLEKTNKILRFGKYLLWASPELHWLILSSFNGIYLSFIGSCFCFGLHPSFIGPYCWASITCFRASLDLVLGGVLLWASPHLHWPIVALLWLLFLHQYRLSIQLIFFSNLPNVFTA